VVHNEGMRVRSLGYQTDLAVRLAEGSTVTDRGDHIVVRTDQNPRYWWGNFILLARAPRGSEIAGWLDRFARTFPAARHRTFGVDVTRAAEVDEAVFTAAGLAADRGIVLTAAGVREPPRLHPGAAIRPLAGADDWRQACELRAACSAADDQAASPEDHQFIELRTIARRQLAEARRATWFGAFTCGRLVAQLGLVPLPGRLARFQDVETHPSFRRQGLAGTLVWHAATYGVDELRATRLVIVAEHGSAATRIYASVGFQPAEDTIGFVRAP
jgi:ribosomal protein S18 acetylase RimI-like enzyme